MSSRFPILTRRAPAPQDKRKNGIADTQPVNKAENMMRSKSNLKRKREKAAEGEDGGGGGGE